MVNILNNCLQLGEAVSRKLSRPVSKMLLYRCSMISFYALDKFLLGEFAGISLFLVKVTAIFFAGIEFLSINENIQQATGLNLFAKFKDVLRRAISVKKDLTSLTKADEDEPAKVDLEIIN